jgi:hypothetical protein
MSDKTEARSPRNSDQSLPFFARFLEGQATPADNAMTLKYPSDRDEIDNNWLEFTSGNDQTIPTQK